MAKRSPILGYNHNVLYRGLVFHVQTEDSGLMSPHLFTHLFHGGVIISTRKLVYDAGAAEDSIKGLMQAQHKVVLKDLKRGAFDDKIDVYLAGTEGLLPRTSPATAPAQVPTPAAASSSAPEITITRPDTAEDELEQLDPLEMVEDRPSEPILLYESTPPPAISRTSPPPPVPRSSPAIPVARAVTAERRSGPSQVRSTLASTPPPPPPSLEELEPPTLNDDPDVIAAATAHATVRTQLPPQDSAPEIQIKLDDSGELDLESGRTRTLRDTDVLELSQPARVERAATLSDGVPGAIGASPSSSTRAPSDSIPPITPASAERKTGDRGSAVGAATLPPARPISRPPSRQAISPPAVVARPIAATDERSEAIEIYAPAPPSADAPPGERSERPGQYAQHKRGAQKPPVDVIKGERERTGSIPIPSGLAPPGRLNRGSASPAIVPPPAGTGSGSVPQRVVREGSPASPPSQPTSVPRVGTPSQPTSVPRVGTPSQPTPIPRAPSQQYPIPRAQTASTPPETTQPMKSRTTTPSRVSPGTGRTASRTGIQGGQGGQSGQSGQSGVVMTRPAVIVGAPAKQASSPPRVRKAREEEGRGFGQGLISEKSLDEVILAYLSEDADDK